MMSARGGIDLGGTKIQAVIVDGRGSVRGSARHPTPREGGPRDVVAAMAETLAEAADDAGVQTSGLLGIGVGSPGEIDERRGTVAEARNLPNWSAPVPLAEQLSSALKSPVTLGNDVQVATVAEYRLGVGRTHKSLLGVFWGTGVGGGLVLDGREWTGRGAAAEIGHMVIKLNGARCMCGRRGCVEAYAGRAAMELRARKKVAKGKKTKLFKLMEEHERDRLTSKIWQLALDADDKLAHKLIDRAVRALGAGIASALNLLDVEAVVLGGGLGLRLGPRYLEAVREAMMPHLFADDRPPVIELARLGDLGGAVGAALLVPSRPGARGKPAAAVAA